MRCGLENKKNDAYEHENIIKTVHAVKCCCGYSVPGRLFNDVLQENEPSV